MNHYERFMATIERKPVDRPACWLGVPDDYALPALFSHFNVNSVNDLKRKIDDDVYTVEMPYKSPVGEAIYTALNFSKNDSIDVHERTLTTPGFFEDYDDPALIDDFEWPDPAKYIDVIEARKRVDEAPKDYPVMGIIWSAHFQDACAAFGMETALVKMMTEK